MSCSVAYDQKLVVQCKYYRLYIPEVEVFVDVPVVFMLFLGLYVKTLQEPELAGDV